MQLKSALWHVAARSAMGVLVMDVREMRVPVPQGLVTVLVNMRFAAIPIRPMLVNMMFIMRMCVAMNQQLMNMLVFMLLGEVHRALLHHTAEIDSYRSGQRVEAAALRQSTEQRFDPTGLIARLLARRESQNTAP